jgi:hypothetical protein
MRGFVKGATFLVAVSLYLLAMVMDMILMFENEIWKPRMQASWLIFSTRVKRLFSIISSIPKMYRPGSCGSGIE